MGGVPRRVTRGGVGLGRGVFVTLGFTPGFRIEGVFFTRAGLGLVVAATTTFGVGFFTAGVGFLVGFGVALGVGLLTAGVGDTCATLSSPPPRNGSLSPNIQAPTAIPTSASAAHNALGDETREGR